MTFSLNNSEEEKADDFVKNHGCKDDEENIITYCFKPLDLGVMVTVKCDCGKELIVNDF